ncbi:MAG: hypothetical protein WB763_24485 [Terriglobia bacterium]
MNVLIAGAGSGIGETSAQLLAERDFKVAVTDFDEKCRAPKPRSLPGNGGVQC